MEKAAVNKGFNEHSGNIAQPGLYIANQGAGARVTEPSKLVASWVLAIYAYLSIGNWRGRHMPLGVNLSLVGSKSRAKHIASAKAQLANVLARGLLWVIHLCLRVRTAWKEPLTLLFQVVTTSSRSSLPVLIHSLKQRPLCTRGVHARSFLLYG